MTFRCTPREPGTTFAGKTQLVPQFQEDLAMPRRSRSGSHHKTRQLLDLEEGPTKYLDRPTNDGKHGDAAEESAESAPDAKTERLPNGERAKTS
jgi:hypothetical protein